MFGLYSSPTATERAPTPAKDTWLGKLLPYQLPNPIKASFPTIYLLNNSKIILIHLYEYKKRILLLYSPIRHMTNS